MTDQITHEVTVSSEGYVFQASCTCGWKGRHFGSLVPAEREAQAHESAQ